MHHIRQDGVISGQPTRWLFCLSLSSQMLKKLAVICALLATFSLKAQQTVNQHIESELSKLYKEEYSRKKEIKVDGKKYRIYNNYVTLGAGEGYNTAFKTNLFTSGVDFNFHLQKSRFQAGGLLQGRSYNNSQLIQFHLCYGYRKESYKYFWAIYGGISYMDGYNPVKLKDVAGNDSTILAHFTQNGIYAAAQLFYKLKFDYGLGLTVFADANQRQNMIGARLELFFSGAFRGNLHHKDDE